jgi:hypothetical protein
LKTFEYRNGPEGFVKWANENVCIPIYPEGSDIPVWTSMGDLPDVKNPETNRSYKDIWLGQQGIISQALEMRNNRFINRLIIFCWPRGEGKSLLACLVQLWKFCCWPKQNIVLGANSKDQVKFVHFDIIKDIILNSPKIFRLIGQKNIQEKKVYMRNKKGNVVSTLQPISSFSGIVSNITGYTFSEMFDMKNPKFFTQLDGSTRNIPNALGVIDSTVSSKQHILYQLFTSSMQGKDPTLFFSYRSTNEIDPDYYWNPNMTETQLRSYEAKFPLGDFERYFLNLWSAGSGKVFLPEMIEATNYLGVDNNPFMQAELIECLRKRRKAIEQKQELQQAVGKQSLRTGVNVEAYTSRLWPVDDVYRLQDDSRQPVMATMNDLEKLGDLYNTDWAILGGIDRADPMKKKSMARTVFASVAKGLPNSRSNPHLDLEAVPSYVYVMLHLASISDHSLEKMKEVLTEVDTEFGGIDIMCGERWGIWDLAAWCEERSIAFETVYPTYDKQKAAFSELYILYATGRFKTPVITVPGSKEPDILKEEAAIFDHELGEGTRRGWFGSPEKNEKFGIQDDAMYGLAWCIYGGRELNISDFRPRRTQRSFGEFHPTGDLLGLW